MSKTLHAEHGANSQRRFVSRHSPLPQEVKEIMKEAARYEYALLWKAGWCRDCKREKHDGRRRCAACNEKNRIKAEARNRKRGHKSWASKRAEKAAQRPPANDV